MPALTERNTLELYDAAKLDELYTNSESADSEQFAEMRSNLLLIAGDHYSKKGSKFYNRIRDTRALSKETSLKLTKNHIGNITNIILSKILSMSPNTTILPNNESEESDIKTAELNKSVWEYAKKNYKLRGKVREWAEDFVGLGECYAKLFWDTEIGSVIGYEQATDDEGELLFDENGEAIADETRPVMSGDFVFERVLAFNLLIDQEAQTIDDSPYFIVRKMVSQLKLKGMVDDDVFKAITKGEETTYLVFDGSNNGYSKDNKDILVRETYFRPCKQYPKGYFYISTREHRIFKGELPFGIWPFASAGYNKIQTSARCRSPVKQMRPYQIEINRTASAVATAQITLGSDKLVLSNGSKISSAGQLPGVRAISVTGGANPIILQGRGGEQYIPWLDKNITELYDMMNVFETSQVRDGKLDPYAMLFHSMKNKQKFQKYGETFEEFLVSITEIYLSLAKEYFEEDAIIPMVGRSEIVNIAEFKHTEPNQFRITVEPIAADTETMLGKQLAINHTLQYVGNNIDKKEIGKFIKAMPFMNDEEMFGDLTIHHDMARNTILALDRGEQPLINKYSEPDFIIEKITHRMMKPDFNYLDPKIKQNYSIIVNEYEKISVKQKEALQRMQQGFIPTGGYLVSCDFYISQGDGKTKRAKLPYEAIQWLIKQLEAQGQSMDSLETMNKGALTEMAKMLVQKQQGQARPVIPMRQAGQ